MLSRLARRIGPQAGAAAEAAAAGRALDGVLPPQVGALLQQQRRPRAALPGGPAAGLHFHSSAGACGTALLQQAAACGSGGSWGGGVGMAALGALFRPASGPVLAAASGALGQHHHQRQRWPWAAAAAPACAQQARGLQLMPRRVKYRKAFKSLGFNETICPNTRQLAWGQYGIRAVGHARVPARTIEAVRRVLRRTVGKGAMMWIRMTPNVPVTSKPAEVRMGKGKGAVDYWAAPVRAGQIIFELDRVPRKVAMDAVVAVAPKLPMRVGFVEWT